MGTYLSTPKTEKLSEDGESRSLRYGLSSMQGWRAEMEDAHSAILDLDDSASFFGVFEGHGGKVAAKFCAKYLHQQVLKTNSYTAGDIGTSLKRAFLRELAALGDKINKVSGLIEGLIWSPRGGGSGSGTAPEDDWAAEEGPHSDLVDAQPVLLSLKRTNWLLPMLVIHAVSSQGMARHIIYLWTINQNLKLKNNEF